MAQTANRDDANRTADTGKDAANKTVELSREAAGRTAEAAKGATERAAGTLKEVTDRSSETAQRALGNTARAAHSALDAENNVVQLWLELTREQVEYNVETLRRLLAARDWREITEIQGAFVRESLSRFAHLVNSQLDATSAVSSKMFAIGRDEIRKAS